MGHGPAERPLSGRMARDSKWRCGNARPPKCLSYGESCASSDLPLLLGGGVVRGAGQRGGGILEGWMEGVVGVGEVGIRMWSWGRGRSLSGFWMIAIARI